MIKEKNAIDPLAFATGNYLNQYFGWTFNNPSKILPERIVKQLVHIDKDYLVFYELGSKTYSLKEIPIGDALEFLDKHHLETPKFFLRTDVPSVVLPLGYSEVNPWLAELFSNVPAERTVNLNSFYVVSDTHLETYRFAFLSPIGSSDRELYLLSHVDNRISKVQDVSPEGLTLFLDMNEIDQSSDIPFPYEQIVKLIQSNKSITLHTI